eukprot:scaffold32280_cov133-Isochrysis_galbana.AAC.4
MGETDPKVRSGGADEMSSGMLSLSCSYAEPPQVRNSCVCTCPNSWARTTPAFCDRILQKARAYAGCQSALLMYESTTGGICPRIQQPCRGSAAKERVVGGMSERRGDVLLTGVKCSLIDGQGVDERSERPAEAGLARDRTR